jgi:glycosyltransferase involved in cell wall biosynthesis
VAQLPYFVFSPNTLLSVIGLMRGADSTPPTTSGDWHEATVDVIIPALNERENIVRCLESVLRQTLRPRHIVLVDDGSSDDTAERARAFCEFHGVDLRLVRRVRSIGKTPTIKEQARTLDSDVLFVLDADTVLESDNYIERTVQDLYKSAGIASAFGSILPLRERDRHAADESRSIRRFVDSFPLFQSTARKTRWRRLAAGVTNIYREVLYLFLQRFVYRGQMAAFGTLANPAGCAVAYRRQYLESLFDYMEPRLGDDLTNSEDIFIGLAMVDEGYRNIQVIDVLARTVEPEVQRLPKQVYLWSSAFLQSAFYFDALLKSPFKVLRRRRLHRRPRNGSDGHGPLGGARSAAQHVSRELKPATAAPSSAAFASLSGISPHAPLSMAMEIPNARPSTWGLIAGAGPSVAPLPISERRQIQEPYRQAFGSEYTRAYGRPIGWALMSGAVEKICFPIVLLMMALFGNWEGVIVTVCAETLLTVTALIVVMKGQRLEYLLKGIAVTPIRYVLLACELGTIGRFASDMWLTKDRKWRK